MSDNLALIELNRKLTEDYGYFQASTDPNWKMVWSEDEMEKRIGIFEDRTPEGNLIRRVKECRLVPKYQQWIDNKYVLERITPVPMSQAGELTTKLTYTSVYTFENPINKPPSWDAVKFIVEAVYKQAAQALGMKYKEPSREEDEEAYRKRIKGIMEELYGDRTDTTDALAYREGIVVPSSYGVDKNVV